VNKFFKTLAKLASSSVFSLAKLGNNWQKNIERVSAGVEITTRQLAKCEWNLELASNFLNLLASLASVFSLLSVSLFFPAN
jgi:hypothetical protein